MRRRLACPACLQRGAPPQFDFLSALSESGETQVQWPIGHPHRIHQAGATFIAAMRTGGKNFHA